MTDRSNLVEIAGPNKNIPVSFEKSSLFGNNRDLVSKFAYLGQKDCDNTTTDENSVVNCNCMLFSPLDSILILYIKS